MDWGEMVTLIAHTVNRFGDRLLVVGNTGSNYTKEAITGTEHAFAAGMDASLQINPYYGKTSRAGLEAHFERVLDLGPALIYNVPGRTGQDLSPDLIQQLAKHPNLLGIKECAGSERIQGYEQQGIACWSGNDDQCHQSRHRSGSHGVVSVTSNILPKTMKSLMDRENPELNQRLQPLFEWLFAEPNPIALNTALAMMGLVSPVFRLPYVPLNQQQREAGLEILQSLADLEDLGNLSVLTDDQFICH